MWSSSRVVPELMSPPVALPVSMSTSSRSFLASILLPSYGLQDVVQQWQVHAGMTSLSSLTRVIGCLLVITTSGLQLPNIFRVLRSRSCEGVSFLSTAILLHSTSANVAYCINRNLPLSTWAESIPLMGQYITLMCLLLLYGGRRHSQRCLLIFVLLYVLLMLSLLLGLVPGHLVAWLKALTLPFTLLGKVHELNTTYRRGGTGQKSKTSIFLLNMRSVGRLLTSVLETCDGVLVACYAHACLWNSLITCQTVYYALKKSRRLREESKRRERSQEGAARTAGGGVAVVGEGESSSSSGGGGGGDSDSHDSSSDSSPPGTPRYRRRRCCNSFGRC